MNFYNYPYLNPASTSLFSSLFRNKINWSGLLENTQRILNLVNQTVPIIKQVPPIYRNAKTMFKVMNEFRKVDTPQSTENTNSSNHQLHLLIMLMTKPNKKLLTRLIKADLHFFCSNLKQKKLYKTTFLY